jgi:hypothetical protein
MSSLGPLRVGSSLSFQPSHAFCLNKIEETDSNNPPLALYEKNNIRSDPSAGCNFVKNTESWWNPERIHNYVPRHRAFIPNQVRGGSGYQPGGIISHNTSNLISWMRVIQLRSPAGEGALSRQLRLDCNTSTSNNVVNISYTRSVPIPESMGLCEA